MTGGAVPASQAPPPRLAPALEAVAVLGLTLPAAVAFRYPTLWFLVPFAIITLTGRPYEAYGLSLRRPGSLRFHVATASVVFGGYALVHYAFARTVLGLRFRFALPDDFADVLIAQFLVVGLSEEFFFRGYLQTQLNRWFVHRWRIIGAPVGWGWIVAAVLFAVCHLVTGDITRLRVIVFGLFAGWLRERTDTIAVPAAYHGFANVLYDVMAHSMVR
jgi:membrane protease YdiL (CAAX protease family)